jgi:PRTRC genetic system protein A
MHELVPHLSCVVTEQEFAEAVKGNHQEFYIITDTGILKHLKLRGGRHIRFKVDRIPGLEGKEKLSEEINFLPNGKVPYHLLEEIIQFFRDVMSIKKANQEAMAHILWNEKDKDSPDRGYRIGIPDQVVSAASADYTFNHIKDKDLIVVDIHSHNTMGAFFSGTDDRDDRKGFNFAGVAGKLNQREPALVWRLNIGEHRKTVFIDDIFDIPQKKVSIPKEWIEKVEVKGPQHYQGKGNWQHPQAGGNTTGTNGKGKNKGKNKGGKGVERFTESDEERAMMFLNSMSNPELWDDLHTTGGATEIYPGVYRSEPSDSEVVNFRTSKRDDDSRFPYSRGFEVVEEENDGLALIHDSDYDENAIDFGVAAADSYENLLEWLDDLEENDKLLVKVIRQCYDRMSSEGQAKLSTTGL